MALRFQNPTNKHIEEVSAPGLWALLFGCFYFLVKGIWIHAIMGAICAWFTWGISWLVYPFFARSIVRRHYLERGWRELGDTISTIPEEKKCPDCAELIKRDALKCRFCGFMFDPETIYNQTETVFIEDDWVKELLTKINTASEKDLATLMQTFSDNCHKLSKKNQDIICSAFDARSHELLTGLRSN